MRPTIAPQPTQDDSEVMARLEAIRSWIGHARAGECPGPDAFDAIEGLVDAAERFLGLTAPCCADGVGVSANLEYLLNQAVGAWISDYGEPTSWAAADLHLLHHVEQVLSDHCGNPGG